MPKARHLINIAPMMDWTDRHYRVFVRGLTRYTQLYTEMVTVNALLHGDLEYLLGFDAIEHPLVLQLGGSDPALCAKAAAIGESFGYDEINLNVGCPSDRVQAGRFGACLMKEPALVAECIAAMKSVVKIPVTVKMRIGVDDQDSYPELLNFVKIVSKAGCHTWIVHARKAWLKGLSPRENREIPPLQYEVVQQLKTDYPDFQIIINGGIKTLTEIIAHNNQVDGVMIGREACSNPYLLATFDQFYDPLAKVPTRLEVIEAYLPYMVQQLEKQVPLRALIKPIFGLYQGMPGAREYRRYLSEKGGDQKSGVLVIKEALKKIEDA